MYAGEYPCNARGCPDRATWVVIYESFLAVHRRPTALLCERHAKGRRDTKHAYVSVRRPMATAPSYAGRSYREPNRTEGS